MVRCILAMIAVFVSWSVLDFVIHGVLLKSTYEATVEMWRPETEMKMGLMSVVTLIAAIAFTSIYCCLVDRKNVKTGLLFGLLYGIATGIGMGYGTYCVMPIPYELALSWFIAMIVEATVAGLLVGLIMAKPVGGAKE